jgi:adenosylmethionine-8-amino-7-oxononanoate transaminase
MLGLTHVPAIELAERLVELSPDPLTRVFYSDSGSTAVEVALRMAFQFWRQSGQPQRTRFISLTDGYHGDTLGAVSVGFSEPFHSGYQPITFESTKIDPPFLCNPIAGKAECSDANLAQAAGASLESLRRALDHEGETIAAVIIEPLVQGAAGIWPQPPSYVRAIRELCDRDGILLICDEVATGFGRTGTMFAVEQSGISPDIMCLAKGLSAGYVPIAATLATERVFDAFTGPYSQFKTLFHGHTFGGNPLGCAAALANLEVIEEEKTLEQAAEHAGVLRGLLDEHIAPLAHAGPIRQVGLMAGFDLLADPDSGTRFPTGERRAHRAVLEARSRGVIIRPLADTMVLMPPLTMPPKLLARVVEATAEAVAHATAT